MGLRPDVEQRLDDLIDQRHIAPQGITGQFWTVRLRGDWSSSEQGALGVIVRTSDGEVAHRIEPPAALSDLYNEATLAEWAEQIGDLIEVLGTGRVESPYPNSLRLEGPLPACNFATLADAVNELYAVTTSFHHGLARQQRRGGDAPNPKPAPLSMLDTIARRLGCTVAELTDSGIARLSDGRLLVELDTPDRLEALADQLHATATGNEELLMVVQASELTQTLMQRLKQAGVTGVRM